MTDEEMQEKLLEVREQVTSISRLLDELAETSSIERGEGVVRNMQYYKLQRAKNASERMIALLEEEMAGE